MATACLLELLDNNKKKECESDIKTSSSRGLSVVFIIIEYCEVTLQLSYAPPSSIPLG